MIFAETMGKFSERGERSEDMLTSTVFGLLRYIDVERGILPILQRATHHTRQGPDASDARRDVASFGRSA